MDMSFYKWLEAKQDDRVCVIMRGITGSGKSTTAAKLLEKLGGSVGHIFSTDNFFIPMTREMRADGEYVSPQDEFQEYLDNWNADDLPKAHSQNLQSFKRAVDNGVTPVIVDNQNVRARDFYSYVDYADKAGYEIRIKEPDSEWWKEYSPFMKNKKANKAKLEEFAKILHDKTDHGVPLNVIKRNIERWQHGLTVEDVLRRKPTPKHKRKPAPNKKKVNRD